jgi:hypothetical protein
VALMGALAVGAGACLGLVVSSLMPAARARTVVSSHLAMVKPLVLPTAPQTFEPLTAEQALALNLKAPISKLDNPAALPFKALSASQTDRNRALTCLTMAIYYEAASESAEGQAAVAQVVLNRQRNPMFPKTICGVVFQGSNLPTGCQFSFTCDGSMGRRPSVTGWKRASDIAQSALDGHVERIVGEATHYHTIWVVPYWESSVIKVAQIGAHVFYRWSGGIGAPGSFAAQYAGNEPPPPIPAAPETDSPLAVSAAEAVQAAPPPPIVVAAIEPTKSAAEELALQTVQSGMPQNIDDTPPPPPGYFGRPTRAAQRLPMRW